MAEAQQHAGDQRVAPAGPDIAIVKTSDVPGTRVQLSAGNIVVGHSAPPADVALLSPTPETYVPSQPMAAEIIQSWLATRLIVPTADKFRLLANTMPLPGADMPEDITYPKRCRGLCEEEFKSDPFILRAQTAIFKCLASKCTPKSVSLDLFAVVEVAVSKEVSYVPVLFAMLCGALGKHGRHPASQQYVVYQMQAGPSSSSSSSPSSSSGNF